MERLFRGSLGALELYTVYLGERLGFYRALAESGGVTSLDLAERTGTDERYAREWLEHHAASGILDVDDVKAEPLRRRYRLPAEHLPVLADPEDVRYEAYRGVDIVRAARPLPKLVEAFRTGRRASASALGAGGEGRVQPGALCQPAWHGVASRDRRSRSKASRRPAGSGRRRRLWDGLVQHRHGPGIRQDRRGRLRPR